MMEIGKGMGRIGGAARPGGSLPLCGARANADRVSETAKSEWQHVEGFPTPGDGFKSRFVSP